MHSLPATKKTSPPLSGSLPKLVDFFAGSGLVTEGVSGRFDVIWANDISEKKARVYRANHGDGHFHLGSITEIRGDDVPCADVSWASFPCQDLSLAGKMEGLDARRSGLLWEWLRILDEMRELPPIVAIENVVGLVSSSEGANYRILHEALMSRGYVVGPMIINAWHWTPQSRPRVFVVGVMRGVDCDHLQDNAPNWLHPGPLRKALGSVESPVWWWMPDPPEIAPRLDEILEWDAPRHDERTARSNLDKVSARQMELVKAIPRNQCRAFPGYRRTRNGRQMLELRFDGIAGCLRTPEGGSSRQLLVLNEYGKVSSRLITAREAARLMGAPEDYILADNYNESYAAMGDAVAVPVVRHLADHLLLPLAKCVNDESGNKTADILRSA